MEKIYEIGKVTNDVSRFITNDLENGPNPAQFSTQKRNSKN